MWCCSVFSQKTSVPAALSSLLFDHRLAQNIAKLLKNKAFQALPISHTRTSLLTSLLFWHLFCQTTCCNLPQIIGPTFDFQLIKCHRWVSIDGFQPSWTVNQRLWTNIPSISQSNISIIEYNQPSKHLWPGYMRFFHHGILRLAHAAATWLWLVHEIYGNVRSPIHHPPCVLQIVVDLPSFTIKLLLVYGYGSNIAHCSTQQHQADSFGVLDTAHHSWPQQPVSLLFPGSETEINVNEAPFWWQEMLKFTAQAVKGTSQITAELFPLSDENLQNLRKRKMTAASVSVGRKCCHWLFQLTHTASEASGNNRTNNPHCRI